MAPAHRQANMLAKEPTLQIIRAVGECPQDKSRRMNEPVQTGCPLGRFDGHPVAGPALGLWSVSGGGWGTSVLQLSASGGLLAHPGRPAGCRACDLSPAPADS